ncbi:unnamed protein product [Rhizophagus irregularis]|nr:unnamed protein product [Rhizophagus irregularis]
MHRRFDFCSRIIRILGISFDESTGDYLFVMQYADVIHRGEAKIIDLGIAKSTETETHLHSGVFGMVPYIDPKIRLIEGIREDPISNTPCEYLKLYQSCWNSEPDARPSIEQVFNKLEEILNLQNNTNHDDDDDGGDDDDGDGGDGDGGDGGDGSDGGSTSTSQDSTNELESLDSLQIDLT